MDNIKVRVDGNNCVLIANDNITIGYTTLDVSTAELI